MGRVGREHPPLEQSKAPISTSDGAKTDARNAPNIPQIPQNPDLATVVERWPELPEHIRQAIKALVNIDL